MTKRSSEEVKLWVVGKVTEEKWPVWRAVGVFDDEKQAVKKCRTKQHFVFGMFLNDELEDEWAFWLRVRFPRR